MSPILVKDHDGKSVLFNYTYIARTLFLHKKDLFNELIKMCYREKYKPSTEVLESLNKLGITKNGELSSEIIFTFKNHVIMIGDEIRLHRT